MNNKCIWRRGALVLAAWLCCLPLCSLTPCAAPEEQEIVISSVADFKEFVKNCSLDTWSQGKTVTLTADLNLEGAGLKPVPTFGGTFRGEGHTISGVSLSEAGSYQGLFRYIQRYGTVQDLNVSGSVIPTGTQNYAGGIVGSNSGKLVNCSFSGTVNGKSYVGGIAGINESAGTVFGCKMDGSVRGEHYTGGIAGANRGTLSGCTNRSEVNTASFDPKISLTDLQIDLDDLNSAENVNTTTDTGGIAGYSEGFIQTCTNSGTVGYPHIGYNVGGVAGRSAGYLENAKNNGTVHGRKDVGGITGQMAPDIILKFSGNTIADLRSELSNLDGLVNQALNRADSNISAISSRMDNISGYTKAAKDSAKNLADQSVDWADGNLEELNRASVNIADALEQADPILQDLDSILDTLADAADQAEAAVRETAEILDYGSDAAAEMQLALEDMDKALTRARPGVRKIADGMKQLQRAVLVEGENELDKAKTNIRSGLEDLANATDDMSAALDKLLTLLRGGGSGTEEITAALGSISTSVRGVAAAIRKISAAFSSAAESFRIDVDWRMASRGFTQISDGLSYLASSISALQQSLIPLGDALHSLDLAAQQGTVVVDRLGGAVDTFETALRSAADSADALSGVFHTLAEKDPIAFQPLGDDYRRSGDNLYAAISGISDEVAFLGDDVSAAAGDLTNDLRAINTQFHVVMQLFLGILDDSGYVSPEDLREDTSEENIGATTMGKALRCENSGEVNGDVNVGGVVGSMAIEYDLDPEDDISKDGQNTLNFTFETKAIVQSCHNRGTVTAKKDNVGGIAGRMDLGLILDSGGYGKVESTDGDYVGGVAGYSVSTIRSSYAKCKLSGGRYVGGIAGHGTKLLHCCTLVQLLGGSEAVGAVAGEVEPDSDVRGNVFVHESLAGIDGVSYGGIAAPVDYQTLLDTPGLPEEFKTFTLTYRADGKVIAEIPFTYGADLSDMTLPEVPAKDGVFGVWPEHDYRHLTFDEQFDAVYAPHIRTIASGVMRDTTHALLLAEGTFNERSALSAASAAPTMPVHWYQRAAEQWDVTLRGADGADSHTIRFTPPETRRTVLLYAKNGDGWKNISYTKDGSALVFSMEGETMTLCVVESMRHLLVIVCAAAAVVLLLLLFWLLRRKRRSQGKDLLPAELLKKWKKMHGHKSISG